MGLVVAATAIVGAIIGLITFAIVDGREKAKPTAQSASRAAAPGKGPGPAKANGGKQASASPTRATNSLPVFMEDFGNWVAAADLKLVAGALSSNVFAIGPQSADLAYDAQTAAAMIVGRVSKVTASPGTYGTAVFARTGDQGAVGYFDIELTGASKHRLTAVAQLTAAGWRIDALHLSRAQTDAEERAHLAAGRPPTGLAIADYIPPVTQGLGKFAAASLASADAFEKSIAMTETSFTLYGSEPAERYVGPAEARRAFHSWRLTASISGPMRIGIAAGSPIGWVATTVDARSGNRTTPYRCLFVYRNGADGWRLVQAHFSTNAR